jgi:hypothetical protein
MAVTGQVGQAEYQTKLYTFFAIILQIACYAFAVVGLIGASTGGGSSVVVSTKSNTQDLIYDPYSSSSNSGYSSYKPSNSYNSGN